MLSDIDIDVDVGVGVVVDGHNMYLFVLHVSHALSVHITPYGLIDQIVRPRAVRPYICL